MAQTEAIATPAKQLATNRHVAAARKRRRRERAFELAVRLGSLVALLLLWEQYGKTINPILFTYPSAIAAAFVNTVRTGELQGYLGQSVQVLLYGLGLSLLVGIPLGVLMARQRVVDWALDGYISALYSTPMVAVVPLLVLWFGFDVKAKAVIVFLFAVFPILINTLQGVKSVDPRLLEVARAFRSGEMDLWRDVVVPSALPFIIAGIRLAVGRALVGMVVAEFYTSIAGLGYMIVRYANSFQTDHLFVPVIVLMVLGVVLMEGLRQVQLRMAPWIQQARDDE